MPRLAYLQTYCVLKAAVSELVSQSVSQSVRQSVLLQTMDE